MRFKKGTAEKTRERILDAASRLFRRRGFDGVSVADLMAELAMTHGGFYAHFDSKTSLVAEVCSRTLTGSAKRWSVTSTGKTLSDKESFSEIVKYYLSEEHCACPDRGCLATALANEVGRQPMAVKAAFTEGVKALAAALATRIPEGANEKRDHRSWAVLSEVVGAVVLARAVSDPELSSKILASANRNLLGA